MVHFPISGKVQSTASRKTNSRKEFNKEYQCKDDKSNETRNQ